MAAKIYPPVKIHNMVADDQIWKDHVKLEHRAVEQWPKHWGFLTSCNTVVSNDISIQVKNRQQDLKLPSIDPDQIKELKVGKPNKPFPKTSSQLIGWRSTERQCTLEKYGPYTKPTTTFLKDVKWPIESMY